MNIKQKSRNTLLIIAVFLTWGALAQPMKKANVIVIASEQSPEEALKSIAGFLLDKGFAIASKDAELLTLTTDYKEVSKSLNGSYKITVRAKEEAQGTMIYLRGLVKADIGIYGATESDACFCGMKGSIMKVAFENINKLATEFSTRVSYQVL